MERRRHDALVRLLAALRDRREAVAAAFAVVLATLLAGDEGVAKKGGKGERGKGGKGGDKGSGKGKKNKNKSKKNWKKKRRNGGGFTPRDCSELALVPGADLHECDLRAHPGLASANFTEAKLEDTLLSGTNLSGVSFRGARLWRAKLDGANLTNADFFASNGKRTDLFMADFTDADLTNASLSLDDVAEDPDAVLYPGYAIFCRTTMPDGQKDSSDCPANG